MSWTTRLAASLTAASLAACTTAQVASGGETRHRPFAVAFGERFSAEPLAVTPLALVEDSRCPADVQCIQAGTVRVLTKVERGGRASTFTVGLQSPAEIGGLWLHLVQACPYPRQPGPIAAAAYRFAFLLNESSLSPTQQSSCRVGRAVEWRQ